MTMTINNGALYSEELLSGEQLEKIAGGVRKYWESNYTSDEVQENDEKAAAFLIALKTYLSHIF